MTKRVKKDLASERLGQILLEQRLVTEEQLKNAMKAREDNGGHLGDILIYNGIVTEEDIAIALAKQHDIPLITSKADQIAPAIGQDLQKIVPKQFALRNTVIPLLKEGNILTCAISDPLNVALMDELRKITGCQIRPVIATKSDIARAIENFYAAAGKEGKDRFVQRPYQLAEREGSQLDSEDSINIDKIVARAEAAPVVRVVDLILWQAIDRRASDIHIEPFKDNISLRYRVDGVLHQVPAPPYHLHMPIVSRIKILSRLDIAEKRLPQDGTFTVKLEDRTIDIRVSIIPTIYGEKVVLRILDRSGVILELDRMGFEKDDLSLIRKAIKSPYGLIFITGPTGSGKSTTLYAILQEIKSVTKNIATVEDPVEYRLDGINQVQVKPDIGLTFAAALRSLLRQDPDIMLVGEVRDKETAEICVRSALTGHLVLSTLHTNDAPSAVTRLIDIGVEPYLLAPSLIMVISQRLVRKLCSECREPYRPQIKEIEGHRLEATVIYKPRGCGACGNTGYKGRTAIAEIIPATED
jgi:type IV pilus assembly protein PilB